jgi:hypothetical protein
VDAPGTKQLVLKGAFWNMPPGKYRASFKIETRTDPPPKLPFLEIDVTDRMRAYGQRALPADALERRDGGTWASIVFEVPPGVHTEDVDARLWTFGTAEFDVKDMEISHAP